MGRVFGNIEFCRLIHFSILNKNTVSELRSLCLGHYASLWWKISKDINYSTLLCLSEDNPD